MEATGLVLVALPFWCSRQWRVTVPVGQVGQVVTSHSACGQVGQVEQSHSACGGGQVGQSHSACEEVG